MFESRISAGATENLPGWEKPHAKTDVSTACLDNHNFKKGELDTVGELSDVFHKSSSHACTWHELIDQTYCEQ